MPPADIPPWYFTSIRGAVREAGGGIVVIVVERDTETYPQVGDRVGHTSAATVVTRT